MDPCKLLIDPRQELPSQFIAGRHWHSPQSMSNPLEPSTCCACIAKASRCFRSRLDNRFRVQFRGIFVAAAIGAAVALLSGCTAQALARAGKVLAATKAESLRGWETATVDGRPLMESSRANVALLISNFDSVSVEIGDSELHVQGVRRTKGAVGSAAPISKDGYFLTAAHLIDDAETLHLVVGLSEVDGRTRAEGAPARVVWKSRTAFWPSEHWSPGEPLAATDIALVHADADSLPTTSPFRFASEAPRVGDPVIIAGWSLIDVAGLPPGVRFAAGKLASIVTLDAREAAPSFTTVYHDAPLAGGDSGGPLLDRFGNLAGIISVSPAEMKRSAAATMPDPDWLWKLIENDRMQRAPLN